MSLFLTIFFLNAWRVCIIPLPFCMILFSIFFILAGTDYPTYVQTSVEVSAEASNQLEDIVSEAEAGDVSQETQKTAAAASEALVNQTNPEDITRKEVSVAGKLACIMHNRSFDFVVSCW